MVLSMMAYLQEFYAWGFWGMPECGPPGCFATFELALTYRLQPRLSLHAIAFHSHLCAYNSSRMQTTKIRKYEKSRL